MAVMAQIQERLAEVIKESEFSQSEIARRIGVKPQQVSCYVKGTKMPAYDTLSKLCATLGISSDYILCLENADGSKNY